MIMSDGRSIIGGARRASTAIVLEQSAGESRRASCVVLVVIAVLRTLIVVIIVLVVHRLVVVACARAGAKFVQVVNEHRRYVRSQAAERAPRAAGRAPLLLVAHEHVPSARSAVHARTIAAQSCIAIERRRVKARAARHGSVRAFVASGVPAPQPSPGE
jgi:hypothetical protein